MKRTWLILGASSSIGRAFGRQVAARGCSVLLAGRDMPDLERNAQDIATRFGGEARALQFDAADSAGHAAISAALAESDGPIGVFLLFGAMPEQADIDMDFELARQTVEVNYLGAMSVLSVLAPVFEARSEGRIVVLSSVSGDRGRLKNNVYGSAKAGLNAYLQGLRARLWQRGVTVTTVKAGFVDTDMTFGSPGLFLVASPDACAAACLRLAEAARETAYFPWFWRYIMLIIRYIPERIFKRLNI
ncbi:MAG: SDR family NAD(P)-dependent oxidoreductase [Rickettsiales bacterium]